MDETKVLPDSNAPVEIAVETDNDAPAQAPEVETEKEAE